MRSTEGGTLTKEQLAREKQLLASAAAQAESIKQKIADLKALKTENADQATQRENNIKQYEKEAELLDKAAGGLKLQGKELTRLGTIAEQLSTKLANANRLIRSEAEGDPVQFKQAAKDIIDITQKQIAAKLITTAAAREQLAAIKNNTIVEVETQIAAKEAIEKITNDRISKVKELIEVNQLAATEGLSELGTIRDDNTLEVSTRRKAAQEIVAIRKDQIAAEVAAITTQKAQIELLQAQQQLGEIAAIRELSAIKQAEVVKRIEANRVAQSNATSDTEREKLIQEQQQLGIELQKIDAELATKEREQAIKQFDSRRNLIKAQRDLGIIDQATYNAQILANDLAQNDASIQQSREHLIRLAETDTQGRDAINSQIAGFESKRIEILNAGDKLELERFNQFYEQQLTTLDAAKNTQIISEEEFAATRAEIQLEQADKEIALLRATRDRLGAADIEGRNAISAKINAIETKKIQTLDALYSAQLERIKTAQDRAGALIQASEIERNIITQRIANQQLTATEEIERLKLANTRQTLNDQLYLAQQQEQKLARLAGQTRSPEAERAYQREVRQAQLTTAQNRLKLLENEAQAIERTRNLAIKAIDDELAARNRSIDLQLSSIANVKQARTIAANAAVADAERETKLLDLSTKALERQTQLLQAKAALSKALSDGSIIETEIETNKIKRAIELTTELQRGGQSLAERIVLERQIAELAGSNNRSLYSLTEEQQELEARGIEKKRAALIYEQEQAQIQLKLDQQKNDLAIRRSLIEARIAEIKAKQAVLDAQSNLSEERLTSLKATRAAQAELDKAEKLAPGRERDRQIADAQAKLELTKETAERNQTNAQENIRLTNQQLELTKLNTKSVLEQWYINETYIRKLAAEQQRRYLRVICDDTSNFNATNYQPYLGTSKTSYQLTAQSPQTFPPEPPILPPSVYRPESVKRFGQIVNNPVLWCDTYNTEYQQVVRNDHYMHGIQFDLQQELEIGATLLPCTPSPLTFSTIPIVNQ